MFVFNFSALFCLTNSPRSVVWSLGSEVQNHLATDSVALNVLLFERSAACARTHLSKQKLWFGTSDAWFEAIESIGSDHRHSQMAIHYARISTASYYSVEVGWL